jgi:hypothetical protein
MEFAPITQQRLAAGERKPEIEISFLTLDYKKKDIWLQNPASESRVL